MTTPPFTARTEIYTYAELEADAALCRKVLKDGYLNGWPLDADTEGEWTSWLSDIAAEIDAREEAKADPLPLSNAA